MFDNYREMSAEEKAQVKAIHKAVRAFTGSRYGNLAWAFVRGFPYRRVERTTRTQVTPDGKTVHHNKPHARALVSILQAGIPGFSAEGVEVWLANPDGAIPIPVRPARKPFVRSEVA